MSFIKRLLSKLFWRRKTCTRANRVYHNKLVRDRIPEIILSKGENCDFDFLSKKAFLKALEAKLDEEVAEYHKNPSVEELADIFTVMYYLAHSIDSNLNEVSEFALNKLDKRGGFEHRIFLKWSEEKQ